MIVKKKSYSVALAICIISAAGLVHAETTIGRWCDKMLPSVPQYNSIMEIVINDDGVIELRTRFGDGSNAVSRLVERSGGIYEDTDSTHGDKFRIVPADGNLQLLDNDGLIRVATRLENTPQPGECGM